MFAKFTRKFWNGWVFGGEALSVLRQHPRLFVFPALLAVTIVAVISAGLVLVPLNDHMYTFVPPAIVLVIYLAAWTAMIYLSVALSATVLNHQLTGEMSLSAGFGLATRRIGAIVAWAIFAATVGLILRFLSRMLESYLGRIGHWIGEIIGYSWLIGAYFVIPIIVFEGDGPIRAMKRSIETIKSQWGDAVGMEAAMYWRLWPLHLIAYGGPLLLYFFGLELLPVLFASRHVAIGLIVAWLLVIVATAVMLHTMGPIARARHYVFATTGEVPPGGDPETYARLARTRE